MSPVGGDELDDGHTAVLIRGRQEVSTVCQPLRNEPVVLRAAFAGSMLTKIEIPSVDADDRLSGPFLVAVGGDAWFASAAFHGCVSGNY